MTINEVIKKYKKLSKDEEKDAISYAEHEELNCCRLSKELCEANAIEHRQIVEWLEKYQKIEEIINNTFQNIAKEDERYAYEWLGDIKEVLEGRNVD